MPETHQLEVEEALGDSRLKLIAHGWQDDRVTDGTKVGTVQDTFGGQSADGEPRGNRLIGVLWDDAKDFKTDYQEISPVYEFKLKKVNGK